MTELDWYNAGYMDGATGNIYTPPSCKVAYVSYKAGYLSGRRKDKN